MKCAVHPEVDAVGFCRNCGKALCAGCAREVRGMVYCESCLADLVSAPPRPAQSAGNSAMATFLGFMPGLGAIYNGEYLKGLIHVCIFIACVVILAGEHAWYVYPVFGISLGVFVLYMAIDANRVAKAKIAGHPPADWGGQTANAKVIGPFILIGLGMIFLLENMHPHIFDRIFDMWWPLAFIVAGGFLAWRQLGEKK
jgi:hypothetical protein